MRWRVGIVCRVRTQRADGAPQFRSNVEGRMPCTTRILPYFRLLNTRLIDRDWRVEALHPIPYHGRSAFHVHRSLSKMD